MSVKLPLTVHVWASCWPIRGGPARWPLEVQLVAKPRKDSRLGFVDSGDAHAQLRGNISGWPAINRHFPECIERVFLEVTSRDFSRLARITSSSPRITWQRFGNVGRDKCRECITHRLWRSCLVTLELCQLMLGDPPQPPAKPAPLGCVVFLNADRQRCKDLLHHIRRIRPTAI